MKRLAPRVLAAMKQHPEFREYKKALMGCCRAPQDKVMRRRLVAFSLQNPKFQPIITGILVNA
jgi:hypothetical protein